MSGWTTLVQLMKLGGDRELRCRLAGLTCVALEGLGVVAAGAAPFLLKVVVDGVSGRFSDTAQLTVLIVVLVGVWTVPNLLSAVRAVYSTRVNSALTSALASGAVAGFLRGGVWRNIESGRVQSLIERIPYSLAIVVDGLIWRTVPILLQLVVGFAVVLALTSWTFVLALVLVTTAFVATSWWGMKWQAAAAMGFNQSAAGCGALVGDILRNPRRIVSNGAVAMEVSGVRRAYDVREVAEQQVSWSLVGLSAAQWVVTGLGLVVILTLAAHDAATGNGSVSTFVLLQAYALRLLMPLAGIGFILSQSATALGTLAEVLALQPAAAFASGVTGSGAALPAGHVEVRNLSFRYPEGRGGVSDVTVDFPVGSFSVIVGRNGAGKSTLAQLLAGFLRADAGSVSHGGRLIEEIPDEERYAHVLYVPQRVSLLNRDLRSNLFYPPTRLTEANAIHRLRVWDFLGDGQAVDLATPVGEGGEALSGGQVQKLELARLLGVEVPCLILDESTSALNPAVEAQIVADIRRELGARTTLIFVAHRLPLAEAADQVLWMENGQLRGVGGHNELMEKWPAYRALWRV